MDHRIEYLGTELYYRTYGTGQPLFFIHGFGEDGRVFENQVNEFESSYRVIVPDLPGSGQSEFNHDINSMESYAACITAILDLEKTPAAVIIGHSMGGYITLAMAEKFAARVLSFGLFHSSALPDDEEKKKSRKKSIKFIEEKGARIFMEEFLPKLFSERFKKEHQAVIDHLIARYANFDPRSLVQYTKAMMQRPDRTIILKEWLKPVLMIIGEEDTAIPLQGSLQQTHLPKLSYIHIGRETGHMGMFEDPAGCNKIIRAFLDNL
ncbi:MAG TPA: alpha/beta hydrolase [Flavitalea sp.]|nr:alpha/beta hydrolase [Flavitalea sp.]